MRPATLDDASALAALSIEVWLGTYLRAGISGFFADYVLTTFTAAKMADVIADASQHVWVSQNDDGIDGFIRLSEDAACPVDGGGSWEIATFYVRHRHHGRGVGSALLGVALQDAGARGAGQVWLATNAQNAPAIRYYLKYGFEQIGQTHFRVQDQAYLNNVYVQRLSGHV